MATVASLPFAKAPKGYNKDLKERSSNVKHPNRSMTYPLRDPLKSPKRRPKNGEPFDPDDLARRLAAHLSQQKLASQRRREARAAKERAAASAASAVGLPCNGNYHHVPTVAASAFQRTATPLLVSPETVHKLAAPVVKAARCSSHPGDAPGCPIQQKGGKRPATGLQQSVLRDQAEAEEERLRNRNPFQRTQALDEAAEIDELRDVYRMPQRTFGEFAHLRNASRGHARPLSTGDVFSDSDDTDSALPTARLKAVRLRPTYEGRNDWAQEVTSPKEEKGGIVNGRTVKERVSGGLSRRKESVWVLMGKKEKVVVERAKVDESLAGTGIGSGSAEGSSPPQLDGKRGFLARFKRTPSS